MLNFKYLITFSIITLLIPSSLSSQIWFDIGLNVGSGTSFITQKEFYQVNQVNFIPKLNNTYSGKLGVNFNDKHSVVLDLGVNNRNFSIDQNEVPGMGISETFRMDFGLSGFRFTPLYRYTNEGSFIELGPEFGRVSSQYINDMNEVANVSVFENYTRGVFGFGGYVFGNERVTLVVGFRIMYDLTELRTSYGKQISFPFYNYNEISNPSRLSALEFQINFELNISLGFLYRNKCGTRTLMFKW